VNSVIVSQECSLDAVFDFAYGGSSNPNDGAPIITYLNGNGEATVARLVLNMAGSVIGIDSNYPVTLASGFCEDLAITANLWAEDYPSGTDTLSVHAAYRQTTTSEDIFASTATRNPSDSPPDSWSSASPIDVPMHRLPNFVHHWDNVDVTWRFDGRPRHILTAGRTAAGEVVTDTEAVMVSDDANRLNLITTNAENLTDIWVLSQDKHDLNVYDLVITRIDP
jgi:hypothetical protein